MADVVILGAGLTGLSAAYHLEQNNFFDYKIFDQNATPGGLARSVRHEGFTFDFTGHLIHINNAYFKEFVQSVLGFDELVTHQRKAFVYSHETYTDFPFQMNLYGLPPTVITECIEGFINRPHGRKSPENFYAWVLKYFGRGLANHFFFPYNTKILSYNLKKIDPFWNGRFVPQTTLHDLLLGALSKKPASVGYNKLFYYPKRHGIQHFSSSIAGKLKNSVYYQHKALYIDLNAKRIVFENGHEEPFKHLITTAPLDWVIKTLHEPSSSSLTRASNKLICNSVVNFNIGINVPQFNEKHWIYFPEKKYAFYRLGFWHNFSQDLVRKGSSSLYGEISYLPGTKSKQQLESLVATALKQILAIFKIHQENIVAKKILHLDHAYVICDGWRKKNLFPLLKRLEEYNVYSIGRFGAWKYTSMEDSVLEGKDVAEKVYNTL